MMRLTFLGLLALLCGCADQPVSEGGFNARDPQSKLYAIHRAGETRDASAIPHLIEQLGSDDQLVRMYAITALDKITGKTLGYVYYESPDKRAAAIEQWIKAYKGGQLTTAAAQP